MERLPVLPTRTVCTRFYLSSSLVCANHHSTSRLTVTGRDVLNSPVDLLDIFHACIQTYYLILQILSSPDRLIVRPIVK